MKTTLISIFLAGMLALSACSRATTLAAPTETPSTAAAMTLTSSAFAGGGMIPAQYTCAGTGVPGSGISPALAWGEPPSGTNSFALHMDDIDAPSGKFVHWVIYNIPAARRGLPENVPAGTQFSDGSIQALNSAAMTGYAGPCPPSGTHRYVFTLYALDKTLSMPANPTEATVVGAMQGHILAQGELTGKFAK